MRKFTEFTSSEWRRLTPLIHAFKELRNDYVLKKYLSKRTNQLPTFLDTNKYLAGKNIAAIIAFEQPWALNFLLEQARSNLPDTHIIVFDNSKNLSIRTSIQQICQKNQASYLALPKNTTRHVNRSHGLAMSWAYHNVISVLRPNIFCFLDHDLIPLATVRLDEKLTSHGVYGLLIKGCKEYWSLWAGFCVFKFNLFENKKLNFLYDFSRGLDTGGRNWEHIYKDIPISQVNFANRTYQKISAPQSADQREVEILDQSWVHMSGISYNNNFATKANFYSDIYNAIESGAHLSDLIRNDK